MLQRNFILKLISIFLGILIGILVAEAGFRIYKFNIFHNLDEIELGNRAAIHQPNNNLTLGQIIQISPHRKIIYELIPNSTYRFMNALVETNDQGFRGENIPPKKAERIKRIIGIGDSGMFGWGVKEEECYMRQLENLLNQNTNQRFEAINTSVPGYNTVAEVAVLENKIDLTQVDLVIIDFIINDFELPSFIRKKPDFWTIEKSFILMFIEEVFLEKRIDDNWLNYAPIDSAGDIKDEIDQVPEEYRDMVGKESYVNAMRRLKELSEEYEFEVLVMSQSPFLKVPEIVINTCQELRFDFLDFAPVWKAYKIENPSAEWKLSENDWHPTSEGHYEVSKFLFEKIKTMDLFENQE